jgi:hypothetical protein
MSKRVWAWTIPTLVLVVAVLVWAADSPPARLRSQHAQPARVAVEGTVYVNAEGNLFHAASCPYLHKPAETMPATKASSEGYAPCTRCMRKALAK